MRAVCLALAWSAAFFATAQKEAFEFRHPTCRMRIPKEDFLYKNVWIEQLQKKGFRIEDFLVRKGLFTDDLYGSFEARPIEGKLYRDCEAAIIIKTAGGDRPSPEDKTLFEKTGLRSLPRITFSGGERCRRAIQDVFIHIPTCVAPNRR